MMKLLALGLFLIITVGFGLIFIDRDDNLPPSTSYYHWANSYTHDEALLKAYPPERLYLKWLDIGWHQGEVRTHQTQIDVIPDVQLTPVVFLDQRVLKQQSTDQLAKILLDRIPPAQHRSLQMDCDWTGSTRDLYFQLLSRLKPHYDDLSVTLRLHQIKYAQRTGTPPAHRGVLMYYNMSDIQDPSTKNYVLDNTIGKRYLENFDRYPLPLDLALPLYQQTRVIRQHKLVQLISSTQLNTAKTELLAGSKDSPNNSRYRVTKAHYWQGYYLYQGDELVIDTVTKDDLRGTAKLLEPVLNPREIIYYKWRDAKRFTPDTFTEIANIFH